MSKYLVSCEHASKVVPSFIKGAIDIPEKVNNSHRAYDEGALNIAKMLSEKLQSPLVAAKYSRLCIDFNRSEKNSSVWSEYSRELTAPQKRRLLQDHKKYRDDCQSFFDGWLFHLAVHSFTPVLKGVMRNCDFSVLYDPSRKVEKDFAQLVKKRLIAAGVTCRLNYPYKGISDGLPTFLRKQLGSNYAGVELEFNQSIVRDSKLVQQITAVICDSLPIPPS